MRTSGLVFVMIILTVLSFRARPLFTALANVHGSYFMGVCIGFDEAAFGKWAPSLPEAPQISTECRVNLAVDPAGLPRSARAAGLTGGTQRALSRSTGRSPAVDPAAPGARHPAG